MNSEPNQRHIVNVCWQCICIALILFPENDIKQLMVYIREKFQDMTFPPKLHMLEEHVVDFIRRWHFPLGFFGEQGGESIHHEFVQLASTFCRAKPDTARLKQMMQEHFVIVHPQNRQVIPVMQSRNLKRKQLQE